ncbi:MAG: hypothetical protein PHQ12_09355 [Chthoniobacteraceae bacterium]|nr:hypothetical protein [Chthoniobacteraceae bacterium]
MKHPHFSRRLGALWLAAAIVLAGSALSSRATIVIVNGGFESPALAAQGATWAMSPTAAPGWNTTAGDHQIEIWTTGMQYGLAAFEGNQFTEINANQQAALYQDVSGLAAGLDIDFSFAHRGRDTVESMQFTITDLGADGLYGTLDDTTLFSKIYSDGTAAWGSYTSAGEGDILTTGDTLRFSFQSLATGSRGNFLDGVEIGVSDAIASTPEPGTWAAMAFLSLSVGGSAFYRRVRPLFSPAR